MPDTRPHYQQDSYGLGFARASLAGEGANVAVCSRDSRGKPEDLGALVTFLASPKGESITGTLNWKRLISLD